MYVIIFVYKAMSLLIGGSAMSKLVSFVIMLDNLDFLEKKVNNIVSLSDYQLIFIGNRKLKNEISKKYNCVYIVDDLKDYSVGLNKSFKYINGDYVNFSFASSVILANSLKKAVFKVNDIICFYGSSMNIDKITVNCDDISTRDVSIIDNYNERNVCLDGYIIKCSILDNIRFEKDLGIETFDDFIIKVLCKNVFYTKIINQHCYCNFLSTTNRDCLEVFNKNWYIASLEKFLLPLLKKYNNSFVKYYVLSIISNKLFNNMDTRNKNVLNESEINCFFEILKKCLDSIDDEIIFKYKEKNVPAFFSKVFFEIKYDLMNKKNLLNSNGDIEINSFVIDKISKHYCEILAIDNYKDIINIEVEFDGLHFINNGAEVLPILDGCQLNLKRNYVYSKTLFFNRCLVEKYSFSIQISKKNIENNSSLQFKFKYKNNFFPFRIMFSPYRTQARLCNDFTRSYWQYEKGRIICKGTNFLLFKNVSNLFIFKRELLLIKEFWNKSNNKKDFFKVIFLRILYWISKSYYSNKNIWITFDKLYKAGDNGEYFYQYCLNNKDNVDCYYIINKNAYDYLRLKTKKNILTLGSLKQLLLVLHCKCLFSTHARAQNYIGFTIDKEKYFRDLMNYDVFGLQHGLTMQDMPHLQNRLYDNMKLYFCASEFEIKNIEKPEYDYIGRDCIRRAGNPRFDGLKDKSKKQILIIPTWRQYNSNPKVISGMTRPYYNNFKNSEYYKLYNNLISDSKLIECAKKNNYKIVFLIHPILTENISDYIKADNCVEIFAVTGEQSYEKLLTESSLMVTDYSGVQFDFAYMKKTIVYYHPDSLPPHYGSSCFDYERNGFGVIIKEHHELVEKLCNYMDNNCKNDSKYVNRCKKFFIYNDYNNCKRIYEQALDYINRKI